MPRSPATLDEKLGDGAQLESLVKHRLSPDALCGHVALCGGDLLDQPRNG